MRKDTSMSTVTRHATKAQAERVARAIAAAGLGESRPLDWFDGRRLLSLETAWATDVSHAAAEGRLALPKGVWLEPVNEGVLSVLREVAA
jgi:hypothetical protein